MASWRNRLPGVDDARVRRHLRDECRRLTRDRASQAHTIARIMVVVAICSAIGFALQKTLNLQAMAWVVWICCMTVGGGLGGVWADRYRQRVLPAVLEREGRCLRCGHPLQEGNAKCPKCDAE